MFKKGWHVFCMLSVYIMNILPATISRLSINGNLTWVRTAIGNFIFQVIIIGNPENRLYLEEGAPIELLFNEAEVILGKDPSEKLCIPNQFSCKILSVVEGIMFTQVFLELAGHTISALLPRDGGESFSFQAGESLQIYLRPNDIFLQAAEKVRL
jgi:molybdopterin-binding protein